VLVTSVVLAGTFYAGRINLRPVYTGNGGQDIHQWPGLWHPRGDKTPGSTIPRGEESCKNWVKEGSGKPKTTSYTLRHMRWKTGGRNKRDPAGTKDSTGGGETIILCLSRLVKGVWDPHSINGSRKGGTKIAPSGPTKLNRGDT
jgi:hypothetical protein